MWSLEFHYAPRPAYVRADPGMIEQVLLNLAVNARDAMPLGGHLSIETSVVEGPGDPGGPVRPPGTWVCLQVTDTGSGIAAEHLPHIFEPFFTTKDVGKGTGLGLATSYGIVQQHGGWIEVESRGRSRHDVPRVLPARVRAGRWPISAGPGAHRHAPRGDETILVVEDEDGVRALVIKVLEDLGYRLLQAQSGPSAIEVWREHGPGIDMLITDIVMPDGMNGIELADRLRRTQSVAESDLHERLPGRREPRRHPVARDRRLSGQAVQPAGAGAAGTPDARRARVYAGREGVSLTASCLANSAFAASRQVGQMPCVNFASVCSVTYTSTRSQ